MNDFLLFFSSTMRGAWVLLRCRLGQMPACERFLARAVDHSDLKQRMNRWEHAAAQVRAPW